MLRAMEEAGGVVSESLGPTRVGSCLAHSSEPLHGCAAAAAGTFWSNHMGPDICLCGLDYSFVLTWEPVGNAGGAQPPTHH